ncbi:replication protein A 70 kDa DNA-binding subunit D-like [Brassica rapa]|nr:replication protein A 70 kDa DNA-binding subunit D-like [Brassica napus]XP_033128732.1 replication protein A 70 kDa DNA-binding subunit D-like [Brassica rapa]XP_033141182.1 replication protein A 70 kDa DNA-binding subunit D-like [Brassica rapa]XP_033145198.1 replication protein A 70 kDa DNA-binding subunit D-like [Brassica rapa]
MAMKVTPLKDVKPYKSGWKVHVKVLHSWKQYNPVHGDTLEMVLSDEAGCKIHASCKRTYMESKGRLLPVGAWRHIQNFTLSPSTGMYRATDHPFKMSIIQNTAITRSPLINEDMFLSLVDFQTVLGGSLKTCFLIDVIGQVVDLGDLETIQVSGKPRMKIEFTLRDMNDARVPCCLWGKFAEILYEGCSKDEEGKPICLIRFAKIGRFRGELQITNAFEASLLLINPDIAETAAFKQMFVDEVKPLAICEGRDEILDLEEVKSIQDKRDKWMLFPKRTIHGLLESTQVEKCLVECEVYAIDSDWGWYYFGCCTCNKKVVKVGTLVKTIHGKEVTTHLWWCEVCKENVSSVSPRFKLHLIVKDDTGETKLMLLDQIAKGMIVESAATLLNGSFDELEDPTDLPDAILSVVGKTFTFGISVEKEHVLYGSEIYKVGKIYRQSQIVFNESANVESSESDQDLALTSGEENSVNLLDNEEHIECLSTPSTTPSTKRKGAWSDPPRDITSTSKNLRLKTIKVEKMSDLDLEAGKKT